ncbi:MAG: FAD-dependent oxidoreductase, partial [Dehalococcoidia bacterium]|nr:FAD-dependent oxidoreductase [Dehalococcoidia bacterium]
MEIILGTQKNIVVLGAGYGGLRTALRLEKLIRPMLDHRIILVDQNRHHQLITQIYEVAGGRTPAGAVALPIDRLLGLGRIDFHQARVTGLDLEAKRVFTDREEISYEQLVVALGSETNFYNIPGMREHSFGLKSLGDACLIGGHIREMLALAASQTDAQTRQEALNFVVGGGGFTGVELAAELAEALPELASRYGLVPEEPRVIIVEAGKALLPGIDGHLVDKATRTLQEKGVEVRRGSPVQSADARGVTLASGQRIDSRTLIW